MNFLSETEAERIECKPKNERFVCTVKKDKEVIDKFVVDDVVMEGE